jgi:signal transduction histidine kinase
MPQAEEMVKLELAAQRSVDMARVRVGGLLAEARGVEYLTNSLEELAEQLTVLYPVPYEFLAEGAFRPPHPMAAEEILLVGREAIFNAFRHADASRIGIRVYYRSSSLEIAVSDDGVGLAGVERAQQGHWGLIGMRERVTNLKSKPSITSNDGSGTLVPAAVAYSDRQARWSVSGAILSSCGA